MTQTQCPGHYRFGPLQARDIIEQVISPIRDAVRAYHTATALKYLLRHTRKGDIGDLLKCRDHLNWAIARAQGAPHEVAADSVAWRHGDIDKVCGDPRTGVSFGIKPEMGRNLPIQGIRGAGEPTHELKPCNSTDGFTQPPNCLSGVSEPTPPLHAVALEMAEAATGMPAATRKLIDAAMASRTLPGEVGN